MHRLTCALLFLVAAAFCVAQQPPQPSKIDPDAKEHVSKWKRIPLGWKDLTLTAKQKEDVYKVQKEYYVKTYDLENQLEKIRAQQKQDLLKVLTADQKKKLIGEIDKQ